MITADDGEAGAAGAQSGRGLAIRERTESDLDDCVRLLAEVHRHDGYPLHWPTDPRHWLATQKIFAAWVATVDTQLIGHAALSVISQGDAAPRLLGLTAPGETRGGAAVSGGTAGGGGAMGGGTAGGRGAMGRRGMVGGGGAGGSVDSTAGGAGRPAGGPRVAGNGDAVTVGKAAGSCEVVMLSRLFVSVSARGYGAGRALMHQAMRAAHERGQHLLLDVQSANTSAIALYERLGWNFLGTSYAQWGSDRVTLRSYTAPTRGPKTPGAFPTQPA